MDAEKNFKKAIELKPEYALAYYNLGCTQEKMNNVYKELTASIK